MPNKITIWIDADNQISDQPDDPDWFIPGGAPHEYRRFTTGAVREQESIDLAVIEEPDLYVKLGDDIDFTTSSAEVANALLDASVTRTLALSCGVLRCVGNHETSRFNGTFDTLYYPAIDVNHVTRENTFKDSDSHIHYTYDLNGIVRLVVLSITGGTDTAVQDWFTTQLEDSPLPVIVLVHRPIWAITEWQWTYLSGSYLNYQAIINTNIEKVQCVFSGHYHWNNGDVVINDVPYISFHGSVLAPEEDDNAFFKVEVIPNAVGTPNGGKPNIQITGYGSRGTPKTTAFKKYIVA